MQKDIQKGLLFNRQKLLKIPKREYNSANGWKNPTNSQYQQALGGVLLTGGQIVLGIGAQSMQYTVQGGQAAVVFNILTGLNPVVIREGTHQRIPLIEKPYIFDIRTKPHTLRSPTGTRDLQTVDITLRILFRPSEKNLAYILSNVGLDYDEKVLPSIINETLKSVVAQFNASEQITQREEVSRLIRKSLIERAANFYILIEDVSITHLTFGKEYRAAVEAKQVAQQDSERAKFLVKKALEDKKSTIIRAQGEAQSATLIGNAIAENPAYLDLRRLETANEIANYIAKGKNKVFLDSNSLLQSVVQNEFSVKRK